MKRFLVIALCGLALGAAGCGGGGGGGGGGALSKAEYQAQLSKISAQAKAAQTTIAQAASSAKTIPQLQDVLRRYAAAGDRFGTELDKLNPPKAAVTANADLAKGEHDNAADTRVVIPKLTQFKTAQAGLHYLGSIGATKGSAEVQAALNKLKALGYTTAA